MKALLHEDGLFDPARKRAAPGVRGHARGGDEHRRRGAPRHRRPSPGGAGRVPRLLVIDARVQGDGAVGRAGARARAW